MAVFPVLARHPDCTNRHAVKPTLFVLTLIFLVVLAVRFPRILTTRPASNSATHATATTSCVDRYNSLLERAKSALAAGDRSSTVDLLQRAKSLIPACPALQDVQSNTIVSL